MRTWVILENVPRIPSVEKVDVGKLGGGFYRIIAHYGFMEEPKIDNILLLANEKGLDFKQENTSFYLGRFMVSIAADPKMSRWRSKLFVLMSRIAADAASFFDIPKNRVIEVGVQLEV